MRLLIILCLMIFGTNLSANETVYYCSMQNFVDAKPNKHGNYKSMRFKMKIDRKNTSSNDGNDGRVSFSSDHPHDNSFNVWGFNVGYLQSMGGAASFSFDLSSGQMFQAWTTPFSAAAFAAQCEEF